MSDRLEDLIEKFASYCACDEYHYGSMDGRPGNHDPNDGHMEFDEDEFKQALQSYIDTKIYGFHEYIIGKDIIRPETDQAFNYARLHRAIDDYIALNHRKGMK